MHIGISYDLRDEYLRNGYGDEETAEFDSTETIDAIDAALTALGHRAERIGNAAQLVRRLARGERWDLVFNIAEGLHGFGREALVPALLDAYAIPYTFSDPLALALALHKGMAKRVVRDHGIATPDFAVVEAITDVARIALPFPLFVKPVAEGTSKGISAASKVDSAADLRVRCQELLARYGEPVLVEEYLPGREFTVGIRGSGADATVLGVMEVQFRERAGPRVYSYASKKDYRREVEYRLAGGRVADAAAAVALAAWRALGCRDAGRVDLRCDARRRPSFIEVNPLAGLHPVDSDLVILCRLLGIGYDELVAGIVRSAAARLPLAETRAFDAPARVAA